jgi:hypothetical protein
MPLSNLLNVPETKNDWDLWSFSNLDILTKIRQQIQATTGNITQVIVTSNGSGYVSAPNVVITDARGNGKGAVATASYVVQNNEYSIQIQLDAGGSGYVQPIVQLTGGGGSGAEAVAQYNPVINLPAYQIYPVNTQDKQTFQFWLLQNSQAHDDFNSTLGLQGSDLTGLDPTNKKQLESWIFLNYKELDNACFSLGIS